MPGGFASVCAQYCPLSLALTGEKLPTTTSTAVAQGRAQAEVEDPSNLTGAAPCTITVAHEIRKLFLVSDNRSFNRLFDLVGRSALNRMLWDAGLASARLFHRLHDSVPSAPSDDAYVLSRPSSGSLLTLLPALRSLARAECCRVAVVAAQYMT
jgi:hypothetical protein